MRPNKFYKGYICTISVIWTVYLQSGLLEFIVSQNYTGEDSEAEVRNRRVLDVNCILIEWNNVAFHMYNDEYMILL